MCHRSFDLLIVAKILPRIPARSISFSPLPFQSVPTPQQMEMCPPLSASCRERCQEPEPFYSTSRPAATAACLPLRHTPCHAALAADAAVPARETLLHKGRHITRQASSFSTGPGSPASPTRGVYALRWLTQRNYICRRLRETSSYYFQTMLDSGEYRRFVTTCPIRLESQQQFSPALRAGILRQEHNARLCPLRSSAITEPCRQGHTRRILRRHAAHVQNDCAEPSRLQKKIC